MAAGLFALSDAAWQWRRAGKVAAFAVVVNTGGSAPRPAGARLLVGDDGNFAGSVSGGCVEAEVAAAAMEVMRTGKPQMLTFSAAVDGEWRAGLSCGGSIGIFVHLPTDEVINTIRQLAAARRPAIMTTDLTTGTQCIQQYDDDDAAANIADESAKVEDGMFVEHLLPARRLFVIGATHIAQCLVPLAAVLDMECIVIDPRAAWATAARFGDAKLLRQWGDDAFAETPPDKRDAVVAITHDPKIDDPALLAALAAKAGYVGALGSGKSHKQRLIRLKAAGAEEAALTRIHAPVGFDIGAKTPAEIAIAIVAEITAIFRNKSTNRPQVSTKGDNA